MAIASIPGGIAADNVGMWGLYGLWQNVNNYAEAISTNSTGSGNVTLTAAQTLAGFTNLTGSQSGGFNVVLPTAAAIITALGSTVPQDGSFSMPIHVVNNGSSQTATVSNSADSSNITLSGTMTVSNNATRKFILRVTSPTTISLTNVGSWSL